MQRTVNSKIDKAHDTLDKDVLNKPKLGFILSLASTLTPARAVLMSMLRPRFFALLIRI